MRENHKRARYIIFWLLYDQHRNIQKNRLYKSCDIKRNCYKKSQYRINLFKSYSCLSKYIYNIHIINISYVFNNLVFTKTLMSSFMILLVWSDDIKKMKIKRRGEEGGIALQYINLFYLGIKPTNNLQKNILNSRSFMSYV